MNITTEEFELNMGPQHPSTHGVLRMILKMDGERVVSCEPIVGYLHRSIEKLAENRTLRGCGRGHCGKQEQDTKEASEQEHQASFSVGGPRGTGNRPRSRVRFVDFKVHGAAAAKDIGWSWAEASRIRQTPPEDGHAAQPQSHTASPGASIGLPSRSTVIVLAPSPEHMTISNP